MIKIYHKTATIKAEQFDGSAEMIDKYKIINTRFSSTAIEFEGAYFLPTLEGELRVNIGDWIATGIKGEHWAIEADVFKKTYKELPVIPKNVADYLEEYNRSNTTLGDVLCSEKLRSWISYTPDYRFNYDSYKKRQDLIALAWLIGYQVEGDK
ncbi:DUF1642 domain-containing protein [Lactobacillus phage LpeD]|uniref:DUF1642 domain-containing protein n=1 Tax=Lactobacillus phage LpeD TaxID=2041210 RepID=A0A291I9M4_9CAUD|nr:DUF1642 domain-containing protein [Lactobacillus phage LpeD]ATG86396.1 DUF1642 domain-containing protein [Lactobacillus phage LpeD]